MIIYIFYSYWDSLLATFWPRLDYVLKLNIQSVRDCDPAKLSNKEMGPHYVSTYIFFSTLLCTTAWSRVDRDNLVSTNHVLHFLVTLLGVGRSCLNVNQGLLGPQWLIYIYFFSFTLAHSKVGWGNLET